MAFEVKVTGTALADELATARSVIDKKNVIPVLAHALLEVTKDGLRVSATDLEVTFRASVPGATVAGKGEATADVDTLQNLAKSLGSETVTLSMRESGKLHVSAEGFKAALAMMDPKEFPTWPKPPAGGGLWLPRAQLREALDATRFAVASGDKRFYTNGMCLDLAADKSVAVGTDGHRVVVKTMAGVEVASPASVIVPAKSLGALASMLDGEGADVQLVVGESHLFFDIDGRSIITRMIDGQYPPYNTILSKAGSGATASFDRVALLRAVRRLQLVSDATKRGVSFAIESGTATLSARSERAGEGEQSVGTTYEGAAVTLSMNGHYVAEFLDVATDEQVTLSMGAEPGRSPMLWRAGESMSYVLAPMVL